RGDGRVRNPERRISIELLDPDVLVVAGALGVVGLEGKRALVDDFELAGLALGLGVVGNQLAVDVGLDRFLLGVDHNLLGEPLAVLSGRHEVFHQMVNAGGAHRIGVGVVYLGFETSLRKALVVLFLVPVGVEVDAGVASLGGFNIGLEVKAAKFG